LKIHGNSWFLLVTILGYYLSIKKEDAFQFYSCSKFIVIIITLTHYRFTALFLGPPRSAGARRELLDFMVQGKINRGKHTPTIRLGATPSGLTSAYLHHPPVISHHESQSLFAAELGNE